jgi:oligosaccharide repeat unit polymerase
LHKRGSLKKGAVVPAIVVVLFITLWMLMAFTPLSHLFSPSLNTVILFILFGASILAGTAFVSLAHPNTNFALDKKLYIRDKKQITFHFWAILCLSLPASIFIGLRAYDFAQAYSFAMLRTVAWGSDSLDYHLFFSAGIRRIYEYTIIPGASILSLIGIFLFVVDKNIRYLILGSLPMAILAVSEGGRFFFLNVIFALFIASYMIKFVKFQESQSFPSIGPLPEKSKMKKKGIIALGIFIFLAPIIYVSIERGEGRSLTELVSFFVVGYNVVGFSLFSDALYAAGSPLREEMTLGLASLRAPLSFAYDILRQLGFDIEYPIASYFAYTQDQVLVGPGHYSNAFYTALYPLYMDGRFFGVVAGGVLFGYALTLSAQFWIVRNRIYWLLFMVFLFQHLMGSIYNYPLTSNTFFFGIVFLFLLQLMARVRFGFVYK